MGASLVEATGALALTAAPIFFATAPPGLTGAPLVLTGGALVEAGEGVAILPEGSRKLRSDEVVFVPLADRSAFIDLVIAWSSQYESPVLGSFLELVRKRRRK